MDDRNYKEILKQAQQILYCTTCGRTYQLDEIRLRGFLDNTMILQTVCSNHHAPVVTFYLTDANQGIRRGPVQLSKQVIHAPESKVTKDDVLNLHESLKEFDGNFRNLWNMS
jgi:hypothetical protein